MRNKTLPGYLLLAVFTWSCAGMKNMSSTLSKSDTPEATVSADTRHNNYLSRADTTSTSTIADGGDVRKPDGEYKKDYARLTGTSDKPQPSQHEVGAQTSQLARMYEDMDKLADVVLYEIDITERRYNKLLSDFKTASASDRDAISSELDKLSANQTTLYKSYVSIYKQGKTDWPKVKAEVDSTLLRLRGVADK
jgi:hypothetical protein